VSGFRVPAVARLLLCALAVAPGFAQEASGPGKPAVQLAGVELVGNAAAVGTEDQWSEALLRLWRERYGPWSTLETAVGAGQGARAVLRIEETPAGLRVGVTLQPPGRPASSSRVVVWGRGLQAGAQAAAGELAFLLASIVGFPPPRQRAPRLAAVASLDSLALLHGGPAAPAEGLAIAVGAGVVRILLAERFISLGPLLEICPQTAADLLFAPPFPEDFVPAALSANALGEPAVYDAGSGALLLYPAGSGAPERFDTGVVQPIQAGELAGGSLALLQGQRLLLLRRRGEDLQATELALPTGLASALSAERDGPLRVYDLAERRIRLLDVTGQEVGSVKPLLSPETLPLPQLFRTLPEGGFLLGGTADLWSFTPEGLTRWRLRELGTIPRESLPAFFSIAPAPGQGGNPPAVYLLDPPGRRLMKFVEIQGAGEPAAADLDSSPALEGLLAEGYERLAADPDSRSELIGLCLREGLLLQAHYLFSLGAAGSQTAPGLEGRFLEKQAERLAELARGLEEQLRLPEAEQAYNSALGLLRELRGIDPVERRFPKAIRDLTEARNAVREILVAEPLLEAGPVSVVPAGRAAAAGAFELRVELRNRSGRRLDELALDARPAIGPGAPSFLRRQWGGSLGSLAPGGRAGLVLPLSVESGGPTEDLRVEVHLLLSYRQGTAAGSQHLVFPALLPVGIDAASGDSGRAQP
jgi:hypothetical protein